MTIGSTISGEYDYDDYKSAESASANSTPPSLRYKLSVDEVIELESLRQEVERYHWKERKEYIVKKLDLRDYSISDWRGGLDKEKVTLLQQNKMIQFIDSIYKEKDVDDLLLENYSFTDIVRAIREHCAEIIQVKEEEAKREAEEKVLEVQEDDQP